MDASSLSPDLQRVHGEHFYKRAAMLRDRLRDELTCIYRLTDYDIFFMQSVRVGLVILNHLFHRQEVMMRLAPHHHYPPIAGLFAGGGHCPPPPGELNIITHVHPGTGAVCNLKECGGKGVVDASHSFATLRHGELVRDSDIFIAPLHKHASLTPGLAIVALRASSHSLVLRSELQLFEEATASNRPLEEALETLSHPEWLPYNVAQVRSSALAMPTRHGLAPASVDGLPFCCIRIPPPDERLLRRAKADSISYFPDVGTLRLSSWARGDGTVPVDTTPEISRRLIQLLEV
ncbi:hypothetical protein GIX45_13725 [Erwinia sp. CPCC 100877]|nr:hypothetical protein [Erwinia sp. CPCC 100877]